VPSYGDLHARDTNYVGAALADDIRQCDGLVTMLSFWTFSDVFEENGPKREPFDGGFGLLAPGGIKKPSYYGFALLHKLGSERIANASPGILVTRRKDGTIAVAIWNLVDPETKGTEKSLTISFRGIPPASPVLESRVDAAHGNPLPTYERMGKPRYPTPRQIHDLNRASQPQPAQHRRLNGGALKVEVPINGLVLLEVPSARGPK
jgi:xylan 1,4-beta-xylosidase